MIDILSRPVRGLALFAVLALAACAPQQTIAPIVEIPEDQRAQVKLAAVEVDFAITTEHEAELREFLVEKTNELVGECTADGTAPYDFRITVTFFDHGDGGTAFLLGDTASLQADIDLTPAGGAEPTASYQASTQVYGGGLIGIAIMSDSPAILSGRLAGKICEEMLGLENPQDKAGQEPGKTGGAPNS